MKTSAFLFRLTLILTVASLFGCKSADKNKMSKSEKNVTITGQIVVTDGGKVQKTGLAPVWIYDATNAQLTTPIPLPNFGGRGRKDWERIVLAFPKSLSVCSNYDQLRPLASQAELKRMAANKEYYEKKAAANGQDSDAVQKLESQVQQSLGEENKYWDQADDMRDLIVLWYNLNPGILYEAGLPEPLLTVQTDTNGSFSFELPKSKNVLIGANIEGTVDGKTGNYFWLTPLQSQAESSAARIVLNGDNASAKRKRSEMPHVILPKTNGFIGEVGFWMFNRVRDARKVYEPPKTNIIKL